MGAQKFNRLYLHIGKHKTGTTALQFFLKKNDSLLAQKGIIYPEEGRSQTGGHHDLFMAVNPSKPENYTGNSLNETIRILAQKANKEFDLLLSTESLSKLKDVSLIEDVKKVASCVKIIMYLRRQDTYIESAYAQRIKHTYSASIDAFLQEEHTLDYEKLCDRWAEVFGKGNIIIRPYEKKQFKNSNIFSDFMGILGVEDISTFAIPKANINPSLNKDAVYFKKLVNRLNLSNTEKTNLHEPLVNFSVMRGKSRHTFPELSPRRQIKLLEKYKESNAQVAYHYLGRRDKMLFYDPWPMLDDAWDEYPGLTRDMVLLIADYIAFNTPELFSVLISGIRDSLESTDVEVHTAASILMPVLELTNRFSVRALHPKRAIRKFFYILKKTPTKRVLKKNPYLYDKLYGLYKKLTKNY